MLAYANIFERGAIPVLRYRNLSAAIDWLCATLGFEKHTIFHDADGSVRYAELTLGACMVMLVSVNETGFDTLTVQPDEIDGAETQNAYFFLANVDKPYAQAKSAGADIILDMMGNDCARRGYSCRDPEGHIWHFGAFNPWARRRVKVRPQGWPVLVTYLSACLSIIMVASTLAFGFLHIASDPQQSGPRVAGWSAAYAGAAIQRLSGAAPTHEDQLSRNASAPTAQELNDALTQARDAKQAAERASEESRAQVARLRLEKDAADNSAREAVGLLRAEVELARFAAREARELLAKEKDLRLAIEHRYNEATRHAKRARHPSWRRSSYFGASW
jgi:uncharacterized glyoxalase superfamily protein PhnB